MTALRSVRITIKVSNNTLQSVLKIKGELNTLKVNSDNQRSIITTDLSQVSDKLPYDHGHYCTYIITVLYTIYDRDVFYDFIHNKF